MKTKAKSRLWKPSDSGDFVTGELIHGTDGIVQDYAELFRLRSPEQVIYASPRDRSGADLRIDNRPLCGVIEHRGRRYENSHEQTDLRWLHELAHRKAIIPELTDLLRFASVDSYTVQRLRYGT